MDVIRKRQMGAFHLPKNSSFPFKHQRGFGAFLFKAQTLHGLATQAEGHSPSPESCRWCRGRWTRHRRPTGCSTWTEIDMALGEKYSLWNGFQFHYVAYYVSGLTLDLVEGG